MISWYVPFQPEWTAPNILLSSSYINIGKQSAYFVSIATSLLDVNIPSVSSKYVISVFSPTKTTLLL